MSPATPMSRRLPLAALATVLAAAALGACRGVERPPMNPDPAANTYAPALNVTLAQFTKRPDGMYVRDDTVGTGAEATVGRTVDVHYTGWLPDGDKFDSSLDRGTPLTFALGQGDVIRGWDDGVQGMKEGGTRTLVIPPTLGYGKEGAGSDIPGDAVLVFRIKLLRVR